MNIAIAFNEKYIRYAYVLITSVFENNRDEDVNVFMLHGGIESEKLSVFNELERKYEQTITPLEVTSKLLPQNLPSNEQWTRETYFRLTLPKILPQAIERILYLDIDMIVNGSLKELYETDFSGKMLCACKDVTDKTNMSQMQNELFASVMEEDKFVYFNAGMLLINLAKMRELYKTGFDLVLEAVKNKDRLLAYDQDLLNYLFWDDVILLDEWKYDLFARNAFNYSRGYDWVRSNTVIVHYAGAKPWEHDAVRFDTERLWWEYAKFTPFFEQMVEEMIFNEIDSCFMNDYISSIMAENEQLKAMLNKCMQLIEGLKKV